MASGNSSKLCPDSAASFRSFFVRRNQTKCETNIAPSINALAIVSTCLSKSVLKLTPGHTTSQKPRRRYVVQLHQLDLHLWPEGNLPRDIKEKNAPDQSTARNRRLIPATLPRRRISSAGMGMYPDISITHARIPTNVMNPSAHPSPFAYGPRKTSTSATWPPPTMAKIVVHAIITFLFDHLLPSVSSVWVYDGGVILGVMLHLSPTNDAKQPKKLRLDLQRDIEVLRYSIHTKR